MIFGFRLLRGTEDCDPCCTLYMVSALARCGLLARGCSGAVEQGVSSALPGISVHKKASQKDFWLKKSVCHYTEWRCKWSSTTLWFLKTLEFHFSITAANSSGIMHHFPLFPFHMSSSPISFCKTEAIKASSLLGIIQGRLFTPSELFATLCFITPHVYSR